MGAAAGCRPGAEVAARWPTYFHLAGASQPEIADVGDSMTVSTDHPVSGTRCDVVFENPRHAGAIPVADIAPRAQVEAELAARAYNQPVRLRLSDLQNRFADDVHRRAAALGLTENPGFYQVIDRAYAFIALCSEISDEQLREALRDKTDPTSNGGRAKYEKCHTNIIGEYFQGDPKGLFVRVASLSGAKGEAPYHIRVLFESPRPIPPRRDGHPQTVDQYFLEEFDEYGVGNYAISP